MTEPHILLDASVSVRPECREQFLAYAPRLVAAARSEPGVLNYQVLEDVMRPGVFRILEEYVDDLAFTGHGETAVVKEFLDLLPQWIAAPSAAHLRRVEETSAFTVEPASSQATDAR